MADKTSGSSLKICRLLVLIFCCASIVHGKQPEETGGKPQAKGSDDTTVKDLMKAVDQHFEKLNARIATLENTVSNMQFYSIRQFNQISGSLHSTNNDLGTVRKQVSHIEIDGRSQKIGISLLGRDITELKKSTSDMLRELESSMVYVHGNIDKQDSLIKTVLEDTVIQTARETTAQISKQMEEILLSTEAMQMKPVNCSVDFSSITDHIELRFSEFKKQSNAQLLKQMNGIKLDLKKNGYVNREEHSASKERLTCDCRTAPGKVIATSEYAGLNKEIVQVGNFEDATTHSRSHMPSGTSKHLNMSAEVSTSEDATTAYSSLQDTSTQNGKVEHAIVSKLPSVKSTYTSTIGYRSTQRNSLEPSSSLSRLLQDVTDTTSPGDISTQASSPEYDTYIPQEENRSLQSEQDEKVMQALYNMTTSVLQAVSYFRNTGRLLEQILSNTDSLVTRQTGLHQRLDDANIKGPISSNYGDYDSDNLIPGADHVEGHQRTDKMISESHSPTGDSNLSRNILENVASLVTNSSQLLEVISDLAMVSSVSLTKVTFALEDEVKRLEGLRTHMATAILNKDSQPGPISTLTNTTQRTFKLVEAVASNTGWIPLIFHSVQHLEILVNRSLHLATQNQKIINQVQQTVTKDDSRTEAGRVQIDPTISNRIPRTLGQVESPSNKNTSSTFEDILNRASFETIYSTSLQLKRIMPVLTKLLSERGPLVTLVGGSRQEEGRVEIYYKGLWGALCHTDLTHSEADRICRHLGFQGGVSAGAGHFGPGSGVTWLFNASCLGEDMCPLVSYSEDSGHCSHDLDASVLCDHMIRIVSSNGSTDTSEGRLEIHHRNAWLPVCGDGWTDNSARVACQQMGFSTGSWLALAKSSPSTNSTWLGKTVCTGQEARLDVCPGDGWTDSCSGQIAAGVSCL